MERERMKRAAALAALEHVPAGAILGVGTGSTVNHFIDALGDIRDRVECAVASSRASADRLRGIGLRVVSLEEVEAPLRVYVDGADEATRAGCLIKGGGAALTGEKIVAAASERFICIIDESKLVSRLGAFPLPVEVLPVALRQVARQIERLGGRPVPRPKTVTDHGNSILDVHGLDLGRPREIEEALDHLPGVVTNGLFCRRGADLLIVGGANGATTIDTGRKAP